MTVAEILIIVIWIALCWFVLYQNKLNRETNNRQLRSEQE